MLELSVRPHDPESGDQGVSLRRTGAGRCRVTPGEREASDRAQFNFAAVEIAKAIASGFGTDMRDHIAEPRSDRRGGYQALCRAAAAMPTPAAARNCTAPRRAAKPIEIAEGSKLIMTSGGYRTVTSGATVARFRKHVSPLTGVVTRLERIEVDLPMNTNFSRRITISPRRPNKRRSAPVRTERRQLRQGLDRRTGRSERVDGVDRALFGDFPG